MVDGIGKDRESGRRMSEPCPERDGFTLLEMLIAFLILSVGLAISAETIGIASRSIAISEERSHALLLVESLRVDRGVFTNLLANEANQGWRWSMSPVSTAAGIARKEKMIILEIRSPTNRRYTFLLSE